MRKVAYSALLAVLVACSVDERVLSYGQGVGSAGHGASANGSGAGAGGEDEGGQGGETKEPNAGGAPAEGGAPAQNQGGATTSVAGESATGGAGGTSSGASGGGGASAGGTDIGGSGTAGSSGGSTGGGGSGGIDPDAGACGDLDRNGVQDCEETLVDNASFATSADEWVFEYGTTQVWKVEDARGRSGSGALSLTNTKVGGGAGSWASSGSGQCLVAKSGQVVALGARALIPTGQGQGYGRVGFIVFGNDGCQGTVLTSVTTGTVSEAGAWQAVHGKTKLPPATRSIYVRLIVEKPAPNSAFEVLFDDVLVRKD